MHSPHTTPESEIDPCAFVITPKGSEKIFQKKRQYLGRISGLLLRSVVKDWPRDEAAYRNYVKLIAADAMLETFRSTPEQSITRQAIAATVARRTDDDYSGFVTATPDYCRYTGRYIVDAPSLLDDSWVNYSIATAFNVLRDYATGYNPLAELDLRFAMTEEGMLQPDDPLYLAPVGKHPAIAAGLDEIGREIA